MSDDLFARAREADIEAVAGVKLFRAGRRLRGECPLCGASKGKKADGAFSIDPQARVFKCFACDVGGDVVRLEQLLGGGTPREAAERLAGPSPAAPRMRPQPERRRPEGDARVSRIQATCRALWNDATPRIRGTLAETYLMARGISRDLVQQACAAGYVRFHPRATWGWDEAAGAIVTGPAMVGQVQAFSGPTGGVHCTYLRADGRGKAALTPAKRMWGPQRDGNGQPGCVWLTRPDAPGPLIVAEGIESGLSAAQLHGAPCRIAAALSLGALQGGWLSDKWGRIDPMAVSGDPERPAFTWPAAGEVLVAVDRDMGSIEIKTRRLGGGTVRRRLEGEERARICAGLAQQAWRRAGADRVRAIAPGAGRDFNDELRGRL